MYRRLGQGQEWHDLSRFRERVRAHGAHVDLIIGKWGEGTAAADRSFVALEYRVLKEGPAFMVIDSQDRPGTESELVGSVLRWAEVIEKPIAKDVFALVDAIWRQDGRIAELRGDTRTSEPGPKP